MEKEIVQLIKENEKLEKENKYLKRLLEKNNINYIETRCIEEIKYSKDEKINIYASYFRGREDVYAVKYLDKKDNKKKYTPVCQNAFSVMCDKSKYLGCRECPHKVYLGITHNNLIEHFTGKKSYGIYPMLDGDKCYFLAVDFDDGKYFNSALCFKNNCAKYGIDCAIEISQSGSGAHVWIFFEEAIKAKNARKIGDFILNKSFLDNNGISYSSFDRFFPSQDYLEKGGFGNLIALPLDGKLIFEDKTVFVDDNKLPYLNQIAFLGSVKKMSLNDVDILLEKIKQENEIDILPRNVINNINLKSSDFLDKVCVYYDNDLQILKRVLSKKALKYMMRLGSVINNEFYEKQRMRQSTYNIPRVIQLFKEDDNFISIPRGCLKDLISILDYFHVEYEIIDNREEGKDIDVEFNGTLKPEQEFALANVMSKDNGVFVATTAFGKTVLATALISEIKKNTLILVNNTNLIEQWKEKLNQFLEVNYEYHKDKFGVYFGQKKKLTHKVDIASIHSLDDSKESNEILSNYGVIIIDEVHHLAARTYERVLRNTKTKYIYGLTATPKRCDGNEKIIFKVIGDIIYEHQGVDYEMNKLLIPSFTLFRLNREDKLLSYAEQCNRLANDEKRNDLIITDIKNCLSQRRNIIVLSDRVEHVKFLYGKIKEFYEDSYIINGQMKISEKRNVMEKINNINENGYVIFATGKYIGEGLDLPSLNTLFITMPFKWEGMLAQYVGRLHRYTGNKKEVTVYDYVDIKTPMFAKMFNKRLRAYKKHNYVVNSDFLIRDALIYDKNSYDTKLMEDIRCAKKELILLINCFDYIPLSRILVESKNLTIKIISSQNFDSLDLKFKNVLIEINDSPINAIIIDRELIWYGEINPFREDIFGESIMRIDDEAYAKELIDDAKS